MTVKKKPAWTPANAGDEFTCSVVPGVISKHDGMDNTTQPQAKKLQKRKNMAVADYVNGVLAGDRTALARAITLIESNATKHMDIAQAVLKELLPYTGKSKRIGITGVPGAGKSTLIETLGCNLIAMGHKLAVLAIDPSSSISKGSVLGDKTRMEELSRNQNCFIRPSPSSGTLGGVTRKTRETMLICEAAGYDTVIIETVGVGQNEISVRSMVDFFLLIKIAGAGDELQGIKKGVIELADAIVINKADGDNQKRAEIARSEFAKALHYLNSPTPGWTPEVITASALHATNIKQIWDIILKFYHCLQENDYVNKRRHAQAIEWVHAMVRDHLMHEFYHHPDIAKSIIDIEKRVLSGQLPPTSAARDLLAKFLNNKSALQM